MASDGADFAASADWFDEPMRWLQPPLIDVLQTRALLGQIYATDRRWADAEVQAREVLAKAPVLALLHAREAAEDGRRKLYGKARAARAGAPIPAICGLGTDELGLASGRTNVIHAALIQGGAARRFLAQAQRLERYRKGSAAFTPEVKDTDTE
jgi:hypothetical protein